MSNVFPTIETRTLNEVVGGRTEPCPDAASVYGTQIIKGVTDGARRIDAAVEAGQRGDVGGVIGNGFGAFLDAAATAKDIITGPSTPVC